MKRNFEKLGVGLFSVGILCASSAYSDQNYLPRPGAGLDLNCGMFSRILNKHFFFKFAGGDLRNTAIFQADSQAGEFQGVTVRFDRVVNQQLSGPDQRAQALAQASAQYPVSPGWRQAPVQQPNAVAPFGAGSVVVSLTMPNGMIPPMNGTGVVNNASQCSSYAAQQKVVQPVYGSSVSVCYSGLVAGRPLDVNLSCTVAAAPSDGKSRHFGFSGDPTKWSDPSDSGEGRTSEERDKVLISHGPSESSTDDGDEGGDSGNGDQESQSTRSPW